MDKQYQKQCPIDGGTCGQGGTCFVCENESLGSKLTAANARIAELEAENNALREGLVPFAREEGSLIEKAYAEGWEDGGGFHDYDKDTWEESRARGYVRWNAALLEKK